MFLYSEMYFGKEQFNDYDELMSWDVNRFNRLVKEGWISVFRPKTKKGKTLYEVSYKGKRMIGSMYRKLNGEEIPEHRTSNPLFNTNVSYQDKVYRNYIKEMNAFIRQQRRLAQQ